MVGSNGEFAGRICDVSLVRCSGWSLGESLHPTWENRVGGKQHFGFGFPRAISPCEKYFM